MQVNLVAEGFRFMVLGMSSVFIFLVLVVFVLKIQGKIFEYFDTKQDLTPPTPSLNNDNSLIAIVSAAIIEHKKTKKV